MLKQLQVGLELFCYYLHLLLIYLYHLLLYVVVVLRMRLATLHTAICLETPLFLHSTGISKFDPNLVVFCGFADAARRGFTGEAHHQV